MSPFHSFMKHLTFRCLMSFKVGILLMLTITLPPTSWAGPLSKEAMKTLIDKLSEGIGMVQVGGVISGLESTVSSGTDEETFLAIQQSIELAQVILSSVDRTVPLLGTVLRTPNLESLGPEGARIFSGSDPNSVRDPVLRAAYSKLIKENDELLMRVEVERVKYDAAERALGASARIIATSSNRDKVIESIKRHIETLTAEYWVKEKLRVALVPNYIPESIPDASTAPSESQKRPAANLVAPADMAVDVKKQPRVEHLPTSSVPVFAERSKPVALWVWLMVGAAAVLAGWAILKRRS